MSAAASRSSRRVATRRRAVVDSDDELSVISKTQDDELDELDQDISQLPQRRTRSGRASMASTTTAKPRATRTTRKVSAPAQNASVEPEPAPELEEKPAPEFAPKQDENTPVEAASDPVKTEPAPSESPKRVRRSATPRTSVAEAPKLVPQTPSSKPRSPQIGAPNASPLADITGMNTRLPDVTQTVKPMRSMDTFLDKPLDIVVKQRTMAIPFVEDTTPKSRIVITYLILTNFKSYAGRQEVGPFHATFSSVVGPNGSGKSNVIDSLLFVFGFRASKMRQGKISALIHNSAQYPDLDHCEVAVHFQEVMDQPGGGHVVIPDSELIISRKAFKNNSSKYYINNKASDFTTVTTLLKDKGVDLDHKRFLILQGETPIEESAAEVEALNDVCVEKSSRVQHVEKEKSSLEGKKDIALALIRDENELTIKQSALYQLFLHECNENIVVTEEAINQMQAQLDDELEKHQGSETLIKDLQKQYKQGSKEVDASDKHTQALAKEMAQFDQERVKFDEKKKFLDGKRKKFERTIANAEKDSATADETIAESTKTMEKSTKDVADLESQIEAEEAQLIKIREGLQGKTQKFSDQIAIKQKTLEPWLEKINEKQSAIAVAESELTILQDKANAGAVALEELEAKIKTNEVTKDEKAKELKACEAQMSKLAKEAEKMQSEINILTEQEPKMRAKISSTRQKADEARSSLASTQTRGKVLAALMRMRESGRIEGFHGRLGNLGTMDEKYDVAVSTACGALDNFVTETVESGQQCIEYLRKNNLGRGNFICLDKLKDRNLAPIQTPENAPRLFDLVKPQHDRFRPAFYHAMQDTLVAVDLAQANRIAYGAKRWRVVTLAGELIDKSGTMSGGGTTVKKGLMSSQLSSDITKEKVAKLEEDRDTWEAKFQEFQEYQRECENRMKEINDEIPALETKIQKIGLEVESATRNIADLRRHIKSVSQEYQPSASDTARIKELQKGIASLNSEIEKLRGETSSVEEEIKALQDKIMEVGGEKLRMQRALVDGLKDQITSHNEEISFAEVRKAKAEKQKVKLEKDIAKATKECDAAVAELEQLDDDITNQGTKSDELRQKVEEAQSALAIKKAQLQELKEDLDVKTSELNETRAIEIEMRNKLEENQKTLVENQKRQRYWDDKLSKLVLQDINDLIGESASKRVTSAPGNNGDKSQVDSEDVEMGETAEAEKADVSMGEAEEPRAEDQERSMHQPQELPQYTPDELAEMSKETLKGEIAALEEKTQNVAVDLGVLAEYRRRVEEHAARSTDLQSALDQRDSAKKRCDDLRRMRLEGFMAGFSAISLRLKEMYQMITMGGNAELELVDSLDPFSEGILFSVMPPKKSWKNIGNLSGGEKTLSSLALVFALHHYKPTPLYVMDEIDAALDFRNVSIVANYIKERTKNAQFIVISLRNNMFELAARLVGVYKVNHMTKSVTIENQDYIARPQPQQRSAMGGHTTTLALR
ncbi:condensin complex component SMC4 [Beauveria bassiana ARSEF 2860]|uniref:Structural maintenance of chromosomes protein n=1 Tax=Beauveria bassiana (strain ARSEF 2860) TaxID=655819 RepID=J4VT81_BEAB2|nr:condensin complex component SMC4 [Beauveria bassiana ARSEF 2860]EJP61750.1 condensin complex component SMC4 [Beauveria bassiana ARSEF 2860]